MPQMELKINAAARSKMLKQSVLVFDDKEVERKKTETLENLVQYYEAVLEAIGGEEIWEIFEHLAKAEHVLAERRRAVHEKKMNKQKKQDAAHLRTINKVFGKKAG